MRKVGAAFDDEMFNLPLAKLVPLRKITDAVRAGEKYEAIKASLREIGLIEPLVVFLLHGCETLGELLARRQNLPDFNERAHDGDVHCDCSLAVKHAGEHGNALLGEGVRQIAASTASVV